MTFVRRKLIFKFQLGIGTFGLDGFTEVTLENHRAQCLIQHVTGPGMGVARARIYGLTPTVYNELASLNQATASIRNNRMTITAGDEGQAPAIVFSGQISLSQLEMGEAPDVALCVTAHAGLLQAVQTADPSTYPGSADAATILENLAQKSGLFFENSGAKKILSTPAFEGSYRRQIEDCARAAGFDWTIEYGTLHVWPKNGNRRGLIPLISADTGMVGYPGYYSSNNGGGITVRTTFNPQLGIGQLVRVDSGLKPANGRWKVFNISHEIDAETPGGQWFTQFDSGSPDV